MAQSNLTSEHIIGGAVLLGIVLISCIGLSTCLNSGNSSPPNPAVRPPAAASTPPPAIVDEQAQRREFIQRMISERVIDRIEPASDGVIVTVIAGPQWPLLTFDDRDVYISLIWKYHSTESGKAAIIVIRDRQTRQELGNYNEHRGLRMLR